MIEATIYLKNGKKVHHTFATKNVKNVWLACCKQLGQPQRNTIWNDKVAWNFQQGKVILNGYCHFGNRTDTARLSMDARAEKRTWRDCI